MNVILRHLAAAAGISAVQPGDAIELAVDLAVAHDGSGPAVAAEFEKAGYPQVFDPDRVAVFFDHGVPAPNAVFRENHLKIRAFARKHGIRLYDQGQGVIHQVIAEELAPKRGAILVGADGHVCTAGAYGVLAFTLKPGELAEVMASGKYRTAVPEVWAIEITGRIAEPLGAKDVILHLLGVFGTAGLKGKAVVLWGEAIREASLDERMTIANVVSEMGAVTAYIPEVGEAIGQVEQTHHFDAGLIPVSVACPPDPGNVKPLSEVAGIPVTQVVIGACSCGRFSDLALVAGELRGRKVHPDVTLVVIPASIRVAGELDRSGLSAVIREAGGILVNPGCGPCFGAHQGVLAAGDRVVTTTARNVPGRMGDQGAEIYLASPLTAVRAAIAGRLTQEGTA
ncbi:MAG TPA: aconitase family protein [Symbiobacteriaceae bacterium]|nr:aconitase family protein [Symbiobacteriaceae bacterium]